MYKAIVEELIAPQNNNNNTFKPSPKKISEGERVIYKTMSCIYKGIPYIYKGMSCIYKRFVPIYTRRSQPCPK